MKWLCKKLFHILLFLSFIIVAVGVCFGVQGYLVYDDAVKQMSLEERVEKIQSMENFTHYNDLSDFYINAVISIEDRRFEEHQGIDLIAVGRAIWIDLKEMSWAEGGSTITQQVAKNMMFSQDKKLKRKFAECFAAMELENIYNKEEIFELYVNTAYFGSGYYGIYDAAQGYFNKLPSELTDYEAAMLAGLPNAPSVYSPDTNPELAKQRTMQVIQSMLANQLLTQEQVNQILDEH